MKTLFVLLPPTPVTVHSAWAFLESPDGRRAGRFASATTALLPRVSGAGAQVVLVVPAQALSWHRLQWPRTLAPGSSRLRAALEGLLEDQLLDEPSMLHMAVEPGAQAGAPAWVATLDRHWLSSAVDVLEAHGLGVTRILPDITPATAKGAQVQMQVHAIAREGDTAHGDLIASGPAGVRILPLGTGALSLLNPLPEDALCFAEPALAAQAESLLGRPVLLQPTPQRWLEAARSDWDLAQFALARSAGRHAARQLGQAWDRLTGSPRWAPARWGLLAFLLVQAVGLQAWAWRERDLLRQQEAGLSRLLQQTFPQVTPGADPAAQMERQVQLLRRGTGVPAAGDLESLLAALAAGAPAARLSQLEFREGQLRARGSALDPATVGPAVAARALRAQAQGDVLLLQLRDPG